MWVPVCELLLTPCSARCSALAQGTGRGQLCPVDGAGVPSGTLKVTGTGQEGLGGAAGRSGSPSLGSRRQLHTHAISDLIPAAPRDQGKRAHQLRGAGGRPYVSAHPAVGLSGPVPRGSGAAPAKEGQQAGGGGGGYRFLSAGCTWMLSLAGVCVCVCVCVCVYFCVCAGGCVCVSWCLCRVVARGPQVSATSA